MPGKQNPFALGLRVLACLPLLALLAIVLPLAALEAKYARQHKKR